MSNGFHINHEGIRRMAQEIQREFNKHPVHLNVQADAPPVLTTGHPTTVYNGPVFNGDMSNAQIAWNNRDVTQSSTVSKQVTAGFEPLAELLTRLIGDMPVFDLDEAEAIEATQVASEALAETVEAVPDPGRLRGALRTLRGVLAPLAIGASTGTERGVAELAQHYITSLDLPF